MWWLPFVLAGCWLDGEEWALKRYDAQLNALEEQPGTPVVDLGLGECVQVLFEGDAEGFTDQRTDRQSAECGPSAGPDVSLAWSVPDDGCWVLSTRGSGFSPVLSGRDACTGDTLFCTDESVAIVDLEQQPTLLVVDGAGANDAGEWQLEAVPLITDDIDTATSASGSTVGNPTWEQFSCEAGPTGAASYVRFTPATGGIWRIALDSEVDATLSVHRSCRLGDSLACTDVTAGAEGAVQVDLAPLEEVVLRIGGRWENGAAQPSQGPWSLALTVE